MIIRCAAFAILPALCSGLFTGGEVSAQCGAGFEAGIWQGPPPGGSVVAFAPLASGDLALAAWTSGQSRVLRWDGVNFSTLGYAGGPTGGRIETMIQLPNGDLVIGGNFTQVGLTPGSMGSAIGLARLSGLSWSVFGGTNGVVNDLDLTPAGDLVVAGSFTMIGGVPANRIATWDGSTWSALGSGIVYGGLQVPGVRAVATLPNGDIVAGGNFHLAGGVPVNRVARWDGSSWSALGNGLSTAAMSLLATANGHVVAGTYGQFGGEIARWDGQGWVTLGATGAGDTVLALAELPNRDLVVAGRIGQIDGLVKHDIARFDGAGWSDVHHSYTPGTPRVLEFHSGRELFVGFGTNNANQNIGLIRSSCPATVAFNGAGCLGGAGRNFLDALNLPWVGSTSRARATGLTNSALALGVFGFGATATPLWALVPTGRQGCWLRTSADVAQLLLPVAGQVDLELTIPNSVAFVGQVLHQQVLAAELDAQGTIVEVTSTNALILTLGRF